MMRSVSHIASQGIDPSATLSEHEFATTREKAGMDTQPPRHEALISPKSEIVADYRKAASYQHDPNHQKKLRVEAGTFLAEIHAQGSLDPENESFTNIARGLAFQRTPHDFKKGPALDVFAHPELRDQVINAYAHNLSYMQVLTMPSVLEARLQMLRRGTSGRIQRTNAFFEKQIENRTAITWNDIGWGIPERDYGTQVPDESTTYVRSQGIWSYVCPSPTKPIVASPVIGPSHPDLMSPLAMADLALLGCLSFVPCDAIYSLGKGEHGAGLRAQIEFVKMTQAILRNHPLIANHPYGDYKLSDGRTLRKHLYEEALDRIGVTLKPHPTHDSVARAKRLYEEYGVKNFRPFDPRDTQMLPRTVEAVKKIDPEAINVFASQVTGINSARRCRDAGACAIIENIGEGGFCSTALGDEEKPGTGMIPSNLLTFYRIQRFLETDMGIIVDGGVGETWVLALTLGATGTMKHSSLIGGTVQQVPNFIVILDEENHKFFKLSSGEAAKRTKYLSKAQTDVVGEPKNVEGVDRAQGFLNGPTNLSIAMRLDRNFFTPAAKQLVFCGATNLSEFMDWKDPIVWNPTAGAKIMAAPHV